MYRNGQIKISGRSKEMVGYFNCKAFNRQNLISMQVYYSMRKQKKTAMFLTIKAILLNSNLIYQYYFPHYTKKGNILFHISVYSRFAGNGSKAEKP